MNRSEGANELLVAGASSYPQALAAINEFRVTVQHHVREVVERDLKNMSSCMGIELARDQIEDYAKPFELGPSIDGVTATIGVRIRRDENRWRQIFCLGWERGKLYCSASIWFRDAEVAEKVYGAISKTECKYQISSDKGEVSMLKWMSPDEINGLSDCLREMTQEWARIWKRIGTLKQYQSKAATSSR